MSVSAFMALSTVFHSINSLDNSPFSDSVLPVLCLPYWSFQLYICMKVSFSPDIILCSSLGLKHQLTASSIFVVVGFVLFFPLSQANVVVVIFVVLTRWFEGIYPKTRNDSLV